MPDNDTTIESPLSIFAYQGKTLIGLEVSAPETDPFIGQFSSSDYIFIQNPALVEFTIVKNDTTSSASMNWSVMPFIPKFVKSKQTDATVFAFPKSQIAAANTTKDELISKLQAAYNELV